MQLEASIERFRGALRIRTDWPSEADGVGVEAEQARSAAEAKLTEFQEYLAETYPAFHAASERTVLSPYAVAYRWPGSAEKAKGLKPVLLLAHYDVVPAERGEWTVDPYGAEVADGFVWARGAIDTKNSLIGALEAAEDLAAAGFRPGRDVWFAFGGDEERSGTCGARRMAEHFREMGLSFDFALDEGSAVTDGVLSWVKKPLALIGTEEKGFLDIELSVAQKPGHSSRPPKVQAVAVLSRALCRISERPFPWKLTPTVESFFRDLSGYVPFPKSFVLANARALGPLFFAAAGGSPETAALMRTTIAMTQLEGSPADNVLPSAAKAVLNLRLLPGWTVDAALEHVRRAVGDPRVDVAVYAARAAHEPVPAPNDANEHDDGWIAVTAAVAETFPEAAVMPFLVTAMTDSRHYTSVCRSIYRFSPIKLNPKELGRIHGHDERISIENFTAGVAFYRTLVSAL